MPKVIMHETKLKLSARSKGISVKLFDRSNNLVTQFPTMTSAAKYLGVTRSTIHRILETGISYDNYIYKFEVAIGHPVIVVNKENNCIKTFYSLSETAKELNVSRGSISNYINTNKLLQGIYLITRK
jgi:hypothetical protein